MPDRDDESLIVADNETPRFFTRIPCCCSCLSHLFSIFLKSLKVIFLENPSFFLCIYAFTCLPLSLLLSFHSLSSRNLKAHIARLEWLSRAVEIWVEADNIRDEARADTHALLRRKVFFALPTFLLSFISLVAAVSTASHRRRASLKTVVAAVRAGWARVALTCLVNYAVLITWEILAYVVAARGAAAGFKAGLAVTVAVGVWEVYLMAVMSLALVVSVAEERGGAVAVRAAWGLMRGRRVVGWVFSGVIVVAVGCIRREMEGVMDGGDWGIVSGGGEWTARMRHGYMVGLVMLLGWVVLWSYVVFTVYYCKCKKKIVNVGPSSSK